MSAQTLVGISVIGVSIILTVLLVGARRIFRKTKSPTTRRVLTATAIMSLLLSPVAVDTLLVWLNRSDGATFVMIDPGWPAKIAPAVVAIIVIIAANVRRLARRTRT